MTLRAKVPIDVVRGAAVVTVEGKVPVEVAVCASCGQPVSTDGTVCWCPAGHRQSVDDIESPEAATWFRLFKQWAATVVAAD